MVVLMQHTITDEDKQLILQPCLNYSYRIYLCDDNDKILDCLNDVQSITSISVDSESDIRRTASLSLLNDNTFKDVEKKINSWMCVNFKLQIGIESLITGECIWYDMGTYLIDNASTVYDATTDSISLTLSDWFSKLNGTRNGQIGGVPTIIIPVEDSNGNKNTLKSQLSDVIKTESGIKKYIIEDIGEFYGMKDNNPEWESYRENNPDWDKIPYDLEFSAGCMVADIVNEITGLYPNIQKYFDRYNNFCCNMIPSCEHSPIILDNDYLQSILVAESSENVSYDIQSIKNITEVFGEIYEIDAMSKSCSTSGNLYSVKIDEYDKYYNYDYIAFKPDTDNVSNMRIKINSLAELPIYYENTTNPIEPNTLIADNTYVGRVRTVNKKTVFYYLGQYQPHALCVLSDNESDLYYTKEYFQKKYNCKNVMIRIEDSPFSVQKIGEVLDEKTGTEFDTISSESVAMENAIYYNRISSSMNDTVTITTKLIPWIEENIKVEYRKQQEDLINTYIIKSYSHDTEGHTTTIIMRRFYPLYFKE